MEFMSIQKAGAIILSKKNKKNILLLFRGRQQDWSFPKGHIEKDESSEGAVIREVKEETGLDVQMIRSLHPMEYENAREGHVVLHYFLVQSKNDSLLKTESENDELHWVSYQEILDKISYENIKQWYKENISLIENYLDE